MTTLDEGKGKKACFRALGVVSVEGLLYSGGLAV